MKIQYTKVRLRKPILFRILVVFILLFLVIAISVFSAYKYFTRPLYLKQLITSFLNENINANVQIESVNFSWTQGLKVTGLKIEISSTDLFEQKLTIIEIPLLEIILDYTEIFKSLLKFEINPAIEKVTLINPSFYLRFDAEGSWLDSNLFEMKPSTSESETRIPSLLLQNAKLRIDFPSILEQAQKTELDGISISLLRTDKNPEILELFGQAILPEIGQLEFNGYIQEDAKSFSIKIHNNNIVISNKLMKEFNPEFQQVLDRFVEVTPFNREKLLELQGEGIKVEVSGVFTYFEGEPINFALDTRIKSGAGAFHIFPVPAKLNTGRIILSNLKSSDAMKFLDASRQHITQNIFFKPNPHLSANVVIQGAYKSSVITLEAEVTNIGSEQEQLTVIVAGDDVIVDSYFKDCIMHSQNTPLALRKFFDDFQPSGIASITVVAGNFTEHFNITLKNINSRFIKFPYEVSTISGKVQGQGELWDIINLQGFTLENRQNVSFDAKIRLDEHNRTQVILSMHSPAFTVNDTIISLLPLSLQEIVEQHQIEGSVSVKSVQIIDDSVQDMRFNFEVEPIALHYVWDRLPYKVTLNAGRILINQGTIQFINVKGFSDDTQILLNGWISIDETVDNAQTYLKINFTNLEFNEKLKNTFFSDLPEGVTTPDKNTFQELWNTFKPTGFIDVEYIFSPFETLKHNIKIFFKKGIYTYDKFPLPITLTSGHLDIKIFEENFFIFFTNFKGSYLDAELFFEGSLDDSAAGLFLHLEAKNCILDEQIKSSFETFENFLNKDKPTDTKLWDMLKPSGIVDVVLDIFPGYDDNDKLFQKISMFLDFREGKASFMDIPYQLDNISGRIYIVDEGIRIEDISARHEQTIIEVSEGFISPTSYSLKYSAVNLIVDADLLDALPEALQTVYYGIMLKGRFDAKGEIQLKNLGTDNQEIILKSILEFHNNSIQVGLKIDNLKAKALISAHSTKDSDVAVMSFRFSTAHWQNMILTDGSFDLIIKDNNLLIPNIKCRLYDGVIRGRFEYSLEKDSRFTAFFKINGFDVAKFIREYSPGAKEVKGYLTGAIECYGSTDNVVAHGSFHIQDALIMDVPIIIKLFDFANYWTPTPINEIIGEFFLTPEGFLFRRLDLISDAAAFYGKGLFGMNGNLNFTFALDFAPRAILYPLPLRWGMQQILNNILPAYVQGTLSEPRVHLIFPPGSGTKTIHPRDKFLTSERPRNWRKSN